MKTCKTCRKYYDCRICNGPDDKCSDYEGGGSLWAVVVGLAVAIILFLLCGCNAKNIEHKEWDAQGNLTRQTRMGQVNFLYWFALSDFETEVDGMTVKAGKAQEYPDPNSISVIMPLVRAWMGGL